MSEVIESPENEKKVVQVKTYLVTQTLYDDDSTNLTRRNDGFSLFDLLAIAALVQQELIALIHGDIKYKPDVIKREVILD
jgi:hypothetical protein